MKKIQKIEFFINDEVSCLNNIICNMNKDGWFVDQIVPTDYKTEASVGYMYISSGFLLCSKMTE